MSRRTRAYEPRNVLPSRADRQVVRSSKGHSSGDFVYEGQSYQLESRVEIDVLIGLLASQDHENVREQQRFVWRDARRKRREYYFDFTADRRDGKRVGYAVKPSYRWSAEEVARLAIVRRAAIDAGFVDDMERLDETSWDEITASNARYIFGCQRLDDDLDRRAADVVAQMSGIATLGELRQRMDHGGKGIRSLVRLIGKGLLRMVRHELIGPWSEVYRPEVDR